MGAILGSGCISEQGKWRAPSLVFNTLKSRSDPVCRRKEMSKYSGIIGMYWHHFWCDVYLLDTQTGLSCQALLGKKLQQPVQSWQWIFITKSDPWPHERTLPGILAQIKYTCNITSNFFKNFMEPTKYYMSCGGADTSRKSFQNCTGVKTPPC